MIEEADHGVPEAAIDLLAAAALTSERKMVW